MRLGSSNAETVPLASFAAGLLAAGIVGYEVTVRATSIPTTPTTFVGPPGIQFGPFAATFAAVAVVVAVVGLALGARGSER